MVGCKDIYSLGDCATIVPKTLASNIQAMFDEADVDRDGGVSMSEFKAWTENKINEYPYITFSKVSSLLIFNVHWL